MGNFVLCTDGGCDLSTEALFKWDLMRFDLSLKFDNHEHYFKGGEISAGEFYQRMRDGECAKTSAVTPEEFKTGFERVFKEGKDILYIGLSSAISTTYNSARVAANQLMEEYPDRKVIVIDSRCASSGLGLAVHLTHEYKKLGKSLRECGDFASEISGQICHLFTVEDLTYLKRGGRISATKAAIANTFGVKPIMHVNPDGQLVGNQKARGRKASIEELVRIFGELADDKKSKNIFISHASCRDDAMLLSRRLSEEWGASVKEIFDIGAVIGAHAGPGTLALFFVGQKTP